MYSKILVPLDGSELAECVLPHVESIATGCHVAEVVFFQVIVPSFIEGGYASDIPVIDSKKVDEMRSRSAIKYMKKIVEQVKEKGINASSVIIGGGKEMGTLSVTQKPAEAIVQYVLDNDIDLVVMATHGRSGISRWAFGSVAEKVSRSSCVPVLMVRAPGCVVGI